MVSRKSSRNCASAGHESRRPAGSDCCPRIGALPSGRRKNLGWSFTPRGRSAEHRLGELGFNPRSGPRRRTKRDRNGTRFAVHAEPELRNRAGSWSAKLSRSAGLRPLIWEFHTHRPKRRAVTGFVRSQSRMPVADRRSDCKASARAPIDAASFISNRNSRPARRGRRPGPESRKTLDGSRRPPRPL